MSMSSPETTPAAPGRRHARHGAPGPLRRAGRIAASTVIALIACAVAVIAVAVIAVAVIAVAVLSGRWQIRPVLSGR